MVVMSTLGAILSAQTSPFLLYTACSVIHVVTDITASNSNHRYYITCKHDDDDDRY